MRCIASYTGEQGQDADWVSIFVSIVKASLNFMGKFWWNIMLMQFWPIKANNTLVLDHTLLVASIIT